MADSTTTKYIYRDTATGRLIHKRQADSRPSDSWTKEAFRSPSAFESPFVNRASATRPVMVVEEDQEAPESDGAQAG